MKPALLDIVFAGGNPDETSGATNNAPATSIYYTMHGNEVAPILRKGSAGPELLRDDGASQLCESTLLSVRLSRPGQPPLIAHLLREGLSDGGEVKDLRSVGPSLSSCDAAIAARGAAVLNWHQKASFCQACGSATEVAIDGLSRRCLASDCRAEHFPRLDAVVMTLPVDGDWCLLGRQPRFPDGFYSGFAGFVELGETLEQASHRETREEAGVALSETIYRFSQPWPFPHALTVGFRGKVRDREAARADMSEIAEVRWFHRCEITEMLEQAEQSGKLRLPGPISAAHQLARDWLAEV